MRIRNFFLGAAFACFLGFGVAAVSGEEPAAEPTAESAALRVLILQTEPFFYQDASGHWQGLEYDLLLGFAEAQKRPFEIIDAEMFAKLFPRLSAGDAEIAAGALTITPDRLERFAFSSPYFPVLPLIVLPYGAEATKLTDFKGKRVLVVRGTSHDHALSAVPGVELLYDESDASMFRRLAAGEADALATDSPAYFWYAERYPDLTAGFSFGERSYYGFAMPPGSPLKAELDAFLQAAQKDGRFRECLREAFGKWGAEAIDDMAEGMFDGKH